jgi:DNA-binding CsgD family transcriptional regulator
VTDQDLFQPGELETMPTYPFYRSHGIGWATALFARVPSSDTFTFTFDRRFEDGPISAETVATLNTLRPHLARAALISCRLGLERAQASAQALNIIGLPAAILCPSHKIIAANERMQALMPTHVTERAKGRFQLVEQRADDLLSKALAALHLPTDRQDHLQSRSIPIASKSDYVPMVAHVVPIRRSATDIFVNASSIVVITPVCETELPCANVIQGLFDLTAAETRVARMIAGGGTVSAIAASSETTEGTVRNQLKSVFSKTGVSRQADLVSLLNSTKLGGRG